MSDSDRLVVTADPEGRVLVGSLSRHDFYLASVDPDGVITLKPLVLVEARKSRGFDEDAGMADDLLHPLPVEPPRNAAVFGSDDREVLAPEGPQLPGRFPFTSWCRCGQQITMAGAGQPWQHCD